MMPISCGSLGHVQGAGGRLRDVYKGRSARGLKPPPSPSLHCPNGGCSMLQNRLQPVLDPYQLAREMSGKMLIDGGMVGSITGRTFPIINPATQEKIGDA